MYENIFVCIFRVSPSSSLLNNTEYSVQRATSAGCVDALQIKLLLNRLETVCYLHPEWIAWNFFTFSREFCFLYFVCCHCCCCCFFFVKYVRFQNFYLVSISIVCCCSWLCPNVSDIKLAFSQRLLKHS